MWIYSSYAKGKVILTHNSKNVIFLFCGRLKTLKKEIKIAEQEAEDRKKKKEEITKSSATKPKRLSKHQYPTWHVPPIPRQRGVGKETYRIVMVNSLKTFVHCIALHKIMIHTEQFANRLLNYILRYESPNIEVQLSGELTGNLRTLKVSSMWWYRDHFIWLTTSY